jgi:hypothetical protein
MFFYGFKDKEGALVFFFEHIRNVQTFLFLPLSEGEYLGSNPINGLVLRNIFHKTTVQLRSTFLI